MLRVTALAVGVLASACAPAPAPMAASEASEHLERFAAGAAADDVCTPQGRALLRGAVRSYGAELARAGVAWPALPKRDGEGLRGTDLAVTIAVAAGIVEASDLQNAARGAVNRFALTQWPQFTNMRAAVRLACGRVVELQQAAVRVAAEMERYQRMAMRRQRDPERLRRQQERLERAQAQLEALADAVQAEIAEARR